MSTYYDFYIGYKTKDGMYHAYGPYTEGGNLAPILSKSRSFISDIWEDLCKLSVEEMDDTLRKEFTYTTTYMSDEDDGYKEIVGSYLNVLSLSDIGSTDFIKKGYVPIDCITEYVKNDNDPDYIDEMIAMDEYNLKLAHAVKVNDTSTIDELKNYEFFAYPDYSSREYENFIIMNAIGFSGPFPDYAIKDYVNKKAKDEKEMFDSIVVLVNVG